MSRPELPDQETLLRDEIQRARCAISHSYNRLSRTIQDTKAADLVRRHPALVSACLGLVCGAGLYALASSRRDRRPAKGGRAKRRQRGAIASAIAAQARVMAMSWLGGFLARATEAPPPPEDPVGSAHSMDP